jgi:hypothetical protein
MMKGNSFQIHTQDCERQEKERKGGDGASQKEGASHTMFSERWEEE